ncbi:MAG: bifunctional [glutamate--ammonia ligase]-adenylyl-L-tyrosine phosphorylase/[glutamate--ammonia-ligase] adenylyltransferase, partial [Gammaproteobacteria bacterium]
LRTLPRAWSCSEFLAHSCAGQPELLAEIIENGTLLEPQLVGPFPLLAEIANITDEEALKRYLRRFRRRELVRIAWRDLAGWAELEEVLSSLSKLGETCIRAALDWLYARATKKHGAPIGEESGEPVPMVVLGLGKLGGCELNFSSDVDLIFAYPEGGHTKSRATLSNHEFFLRLGRRLINVLSEATSEGIVWRVDMRLRPNGNSGPLALNYGAMEQYYQLHGREWERYALIKARVVAGEAAAGEELLTRLRPFVYRRYLDYGALEGMRELKLTIDRDVLRKGMQADIKRGQGGIREVEFIAQAFQLIRGSREPELRERSLLKTLSTLAQRKYLNAQAAEELGAAYRFLRNTENRLQMIADRQTHKLPQDGINQLRLASAMGFSDWISFKTVLAAHRESVQRHFNRVFAAPRHETTGSSDQT